MREPLKEVLMRRDEMTEGEADDIINRAKEDLYEMLEKGEDPGDICEDWFGLEPDYIDDLM